MGCSIRSYLRASWRALVAFVLCMLALQLVLFLSVPLRSVWAEALYLDLLLAALAAACYVYGFLHHRSRYRRLRKALEDGGEVAPALDGRSRAEDVRILDACVRREAALGEEKRAALQRQLRDQQAELARWAHEVKTPVAVCRLILERTEAEPIRAPLGRQLERVEAQVAHVLQGERLRGLEQSLRMARLNAEKLLREAISRAAPLLRARGLEVELEAPDVAAMGDEQCASYVLDQLITNAAKYAPEGSLIRVRAEEGDRVIRLSVQDQGPGIPVQDARRVFDMGYSGEQRGHAQSSGMGLYYAKKTAEALGGRLTLDTDPGGSTFTLELPKLQDYLAPAANTNSRH